MADHIGHVAQAESIADCGADAVGVGDGVADVDVARWVVTGEGGAAVAAGVVLDVASVDGTVAAGIEAVRDGAGAVEPSIVYVGNASSAEGIEIGSSVVCGNVDVGQG